MNPRSMKLISVACLGSVLALVQMPSFGQRPAGRLAQQLRERDADGNRPNDFSAWTKPGLAVRVKNIGRCRINDCTPSRPRRFRR